jgi:hypothetical protein
MSQSASLIKLSSRTFYCNNVEASQNRPSPLYKLRLSTRPALQPRHSPPGSTALGSANHPAACPRYEIRSLRGFPTSLAPPCRRRIRSRANPERRPSSSALPSRLRQRNAWGQSLRPACRRMLLSVPGCKSALSLPGTVTRPLLEPWVNWRWLPFVAARIHPSSSRRRMISLTVVGMGS